MILRCKCMVHLSICIRMYEYSAHTCKCYIYVYFERQQSVCMRVLKIKTNKSEGAHVCNVHMYMHMLRCLPECTLYIVRMGSLNDAPTSWWRRICRGLRYSAAPISWCTGRGTGKVAQVSDQVREAVSVSVAVSADRHEQSLHVSQKIVFCAQECRYRHAFLPSHLQWLSVRGRLWKCWRKKRWS